MKIKKAKIIFEFDEKTDAVMREVLENTKEIKRLQQENNRLLSENLARNGRLGSL